jgi:hypothetical protein
MKKNNINMANTKTNTNEIIHEFKIGNMPDLPPLYKRNDYFSNNSKRAARLLKLFRLDQYFRKSRLYWCDSFILVSHVPKYLNVIHLTK